MEVVTLWFRSTMGGTVSDDKRLAMDRFEVGRALRQAQHVAIGEITDTSEAIRELARAIAELAHAVEHLLERQEDVSPV